MNGINALRFAIFALGILLGSQSLCAQPLARDHITLESLVAPAEFVAIGSIKQVKEQVILEPDGVDKTGRRIERGQIQYELKPNFSETIKQAGKPDHSREFQTLKTLDLQIGQSTRLADLVDKKTQGLWIFYPQGKSEKFRRWKFKPFGKSGVDHFGYQVPPLKTPMFSSDFSILKSRQQILDRLRSYGRISQMEHDPTQLAVTYVNIPHDLLADFEVGDYNRLILPVDFSTVRIARQLIETPRSILSKQLIDVYSIDRVCAAGIDWLGSRKNNAHIELLKECLDADKQPFSDCRQPIQMRTKAYEKLLGWRCELPAPDFAEQVHSLVLASSEVDDLTLKQVSNLVNLETLILWDTQVTHEGIAYLAKLHRLRRLDLDDLVISDQLLGVLADHDQLLALTQLTTADEARRPTATEQVQKIKFWCAPITDSGLLQLKRFSNLTHMDLGRMGISDKSIPLLSSFKRLKFLDLHETRISKTGAARLKKLLPDCKVEVRNSVYQ